MVFPKIRLQCCTKMSLNSNITLLSWCMSVCSEKVTKLEKGKTSL